MCLVSGKEEPMTGTRRVSTQVEPGRGEHLRTPWGETAAGKVTGAQTGGAFSLAELLTPSGWFRPAYVHHEVDECFYVVEGRFTVALDDRDDVAELAAGSVLFVPRGVARSLRSTGGGGRLLILQTPGRSLDAAQSLAGIESLHSRPAPNGCHSQHS